MSRRIVAYDRNLIQLLSFILEADASVRKTLITILRIRVFPEKRNRVFIRLRSLLVFPVVHRDNNGNLVESTLMDILKPLKPYIVSPILSGYIMSLVQTLPLPDDLGSLLKLEAVKKEVLASTEKREPTIFNWNSVFSADPRIRNTNPLAPFYHLSPDISTRIFNCLQYSKTRISQTLFYPQYSHKSIGERACTELARVWKEEDIRYEGSTFGLEILYHRHGVELEGKTEMRVSFKYNDLRPRCYFAQGPNQYYSSRYIQPIFNLILDSIPGVHRETRFEISGIRMTEDETLFIYDYTSFTSNLVEIGSFTKELANFFRGTMVKLVDTFHGIVEIDLGDLLDIYCNCCNNYPSFEIRRSLDPELFAEEISFLHHSGMLGVPGNISSSTLLHGIHLMILCLSMYVRCVGDDAIGKLLIQGPDGKDMLYTSLRNLGDIALQKMEFWESIPLEEEDFDSIMWNYTKRPICRSGERVLLSPTRIVFPSLGTIFPDLADADHTSGNPRDRTSVARMLITFCRQFHSYDLEDVEKVILSRWLDEVLLRSGLKSVSNTGVTVYALGIIFPRSVEECNLETMLERYYCSRELLAIPDLHCVQSEVARHACFVSKYQKPMKLIEDLGYGKKKLKMRKGLAKDLYEDIKTIFFERYSLFYDVVVYESCPDFLYDLLETVDPMEEEDYYFANIGSLEEIGF